MVVVDHNKNIQRNNKIRKKKVTKKVSKKVSKKEPKQGDAPKGLDKPVDYDLKGVVVKDNGKLIPNKGRAPLGEVQHYLSMRDAK